MQPYTIGIATCYGSWNLLETVKSIRKSAVKSAKTAPIIVVADTLPITAEIKTALTKLKVKLIENTTRKSQFQKVLQMLPLIKTDLFILTQDDVRFEKDTLKYILNAFEENPNLTFAMTAVDCEKAINIFQYILNCGTKLSLQISSLWNRGNNYLGANGRCIAGKTQAWKALTFPQSLVNADAYIYFSCKAYGWAYRYIKHAIVHTPNPATFKEYKRKLDRFSFSQKEIAYFYPQLQPLLSREYRIPPAVMLQAIVRVFARSPLATLLYVGFKICTFWLAPDPSMQRMAVWDAEVSTKVV